MKIGNLRNIGSLNNVWQLMNELPAITALDAATKCLIFGDSIGDASGKAVTAVGTAAVSTAQYKFAELGRSIFFDGNSDYLTLADSADWDITADFTIDFWVRFPSVTATTQGLIQFRESDTNHWRIAIDPTGSIELSVRSGGAEIINPVSAFSALTENTWYHFALTRAGNNYRWFKNGAQIDNTIVDSDTFPAFAGTLYIGYNRRWEGTTFYMNGYMSAIRITKGTALWTSNFTIPVYSDYKGARTIYVASDLNGDVDEEYMLKARIVNGYAGNQNMYIRCNNDSGSNYGYQVLYGTDTTIGAERAIITGLPIMRNSATGCVQLTNMFIYAKSGYVRTAIIDEVRNIIGTTVSLLVSGGYSWNNTVDNITSLVIISDKTSGLGVGSHIELYRRIS